MTGARSSMRPWVGGGWGIPVTGGSLLTSRIASVFWCFFVIWFFVMLRFFVGLVFELVTRLPLRTVVAIHWSRDVFLSSSWESFFWISNRSLTESGVGWLCCILNELLVFVPIFENRQKWQPFHTARKDEAAIAW